MGCVLGCMPLLLMVGMPCARQSGQVMSTAWETHHCPRAAGDMSPRGTKPRSEELPG